MLGILSILSYSGDCRVGFIGLLLSKSYGGGGEGVGLFRTSYVGWTLRPGVEGPWVGGGGGVRGGGSGGGHGERLMTGSAVKEQSKPLGTWKNMFSKLARRI